MLRLIKFREALAGPCVVYTLRVGESCDGQKFNIDVNTCTVESNLCANQLSL